MTASLPSRWTSPGALKRAFGAIRDLSVASSCLWSAWLYLAASALGSVTMVVIAVPFGIPLRTLGPTTGGPHAGDLTAQALTRGGTNLCIPTPKRCHSTWQYGDRRCDGSFVFSSVRRRPEPNREVRRRDHREAPGRRASGPKSRR